MKQIQIETSNGIYTVKLPIGRVGAKHFAILTKAIPDRSAEELKLIRDAQEIAKTAGKEVDIPEFVMSEKDKERMADAFEKWAAEVLPHILIDGPCKNAQNKCVVDEMLGEDQYAIFLAMLEQLKVDDKLFRVIG